MDSCLQDPSSSAALAGILRRLCIPDTTVQTALRIYERVDATRETLRSTNSRPAVHPCDQYRTVQLREMLRDSYAVMVACLTIAHKYRRDVPLTNDAWARASRLDTALLNQLEREILRILGYCIDAEGIIPVDALEPRPKRRGFYKRAAFFKKVFCF